MSSSSFNLVVRDNLASTQDDFGRSDVRGFDTTPVVCGTAPACGCRIPPDPDAEPERWFEITSGQETGFDVAACEDARVFFNQEKTAFAGRRPLLSGDCLRVGHYTFRFQRVRKRAASQRRTDLLSGFAKVILVFIFLFEVGLVYWLPRKLKNSQVMARTILAQNVFKELDSLRKDLHRAEKHADDSSLPSLTRSIVDEELTQLAHYLRENEKALSRDQWRQIRGNLARYDLLLKQADSGRLGAPLPELERDLAVRKILEKHDVSF